jgi:hypothetical protein
MKLIIIIRIIIDFILESVSEFMIYVLSLLLKYLFAIVSPSIILIFLFIQVFTTKPTTIVLKFFPIILLFFQI